MARMYPDPMLPISDPRNTAEPRLYDWLKHSLSNEYHVFHSVAWQTRDELRGARDGEADFVIVHPRLGILVLEVKGGQIEYDGLQGVWLQNGRALDKDPFTQAKSFKHHLLNLLKADGYWANRYILISHAVAFPDVVAPNTPLTLQSPRRLILDKRDTLTIREWIEAHFVYAGGSQDWDALGEHGVRYLQNLLAPVRHLRSLLGVDIKSEAAEFVKLTETQCRLLDFIASCPRAAISGCAGSGKTMLAAHKAVQLAEEGLNVLFTCYNKNLANFLAHDYLAERPKTLHIAHFHKVAADLIRQSKQPLGQLPGESEEDYFNYRLPEQMVTALDILPARYHALVIDEAQDFRENWWLPLQFLLEKPEEDTLYLFYDDNQNLYGGLARFKNLTEIQFALTENCRNTQKIHEVVSRFYKGSKQLRALGPHGRDVKIRTYQDEAELHKSLRQTLHELIVEEGVDREDIVVLTPRSMTYTTLKGKYGRFQLNTNWNVQENEVFIATIHSYKGLESPVIILAELEPTLPKLNELLYVACSRARHHLVVVCHEQTKSVLVSN